MGKSTIDERERIVIPKYLLEELGLSRGDAVALERKGNLLVLKKLEKPKKRLEEIMSWEPKTHRQA